MQMHFIMRHCNCANVLSIVYSIRFRRSWRLLHAHSNDNKNSGLPRSKHATIFIDHVNMLADNEGMLLVPSGLRGLSCDEVEAKNGCSLLPVGLDEPFEVGATETLLAPLLQASTPDQLLLDYNSTSPVDFSAAPTVVDFVELLADKPKVAATGDSKFLKRFRLGAESTWRRGYFRRQKTTF